MPNYRIKLSTPQIKFREYLYLLKSLKSNQIAQGEYIEKFENELAQISGRKYAVALSSGTAALHLALLSLKIGYNSKVIVPTLTFAATAFAASYTGSKIVFLDCNMNDLNIDLNILEEYLSKNANEIDLIIIVDLFGIPCDYDRLKKIASKYSIKIIQDAAEALGSEFNGIRSGGFGDISIISFNGNKIATTGGGGVILTDDRNISEYIRKISTQAREKTIWYEHNEIGYNYRISNISAAIGYAQIKTIRKKIAKKQKIHNWYKEYLNHDLVRLIDSPKNSISNYWLNIIQIISPKNKDTNYQLIEKLQQNSIEARPIWKPLHMQPVFSSAEKHSAINAEKLFESSLCLPSDLSLNKKDVKRVAEKINEFLKL